MFSKNTSRLHFIIFLYLPVSVAVEMSSPIYGCVIQLSLSLVLAPVIVELPQFFSTVKLVGPAGPVFV